MRTPLSPSQIRSGPARRPLQLSRLEPRILFSAASSQQLLSSVVAAAIEPDLEAIDPFTETPPDEVTTDSSHHLGQLINPIEAVYPADIAEESDPTIAFPGAEGAGAFAQGGRGGDVYHVTNLDNDGPGSLRYGIENMVEPRTIVFDVSGTIALESNIHARQPYLTIAGQTAPGDGIAIMNYKLQIDRTHDVVIRHLRFRPGDLPDELREPNSPIARTHDAITIYLSNDVIVDHSSLSWAIDEVVDTGRSSDVTIQWSIISESLVHSYHPLGPQGYGSLHDFPGTISLHHNLYAHHSWRMPRIISSDVDVVNNVFYDFVSIPSSVGLRNNTATEFGSANFENNYYVVGPSLSDFWWHGKPIQNLDESVVWVQGNVVDETIDGVANPQLLDYAILNEASERISFPEVPTQSAVEAYQSILASAGASLMRDAVDQRIVFNVINQTGSTIDSQSEIGGWPELHSLPTPLDTDQDGMPDRWENRFAYLDASNPSDRNGDFDDDGFTNLEEYLNYLTGPTTVLPFVVGPDEVTVGETVSVVLADASAIPDEGQTYDIEIDWNGDGSFDETLTVPLNSTVEHSYGTPGSYEMTARTVSLSGDHVVWTHTIDIANPATDQPIELPPGNTAAAVDGEWAVVGEHQDSDATTSIGTATVLRRLGDEWVVAAELVPPDGGAADYFGSSVDISGDTLVVGAYRHDTPSRTGRPQRNAGAAYVYELDASNNWIFVQQLRSEDGHGGDKFGYSVAIDGDTVVVGAYHADPVGRASGAAYVFQRDLGGLNNWRQSASLAAADGASTDLFGRSVAIDGDRIVVGADLHDTTELNSGAAYVFGRNKGGSDKWGQTAKLVSDTPIAADRFGFTVGVSGDTIAVGAFLNDEHRRSSGATFVFQLDSAPWSIRETWDQVQRLTASDYGTGSRFGESLSLSGNLLVIGAPKDDSSFDSAGGVYVYTRNVDGIWDSETKVYAGDTENALVGKSVSTDGSTILSGALGNGLVINDYDARSVSVTTTAANNPPRSEQQETDTLLHLAGGAPYFESAISGWPWRLSSSSPVPWWQQQPASQENQDQDSITGVTNGAVLPPLL